MPFYKLEKLINLYDGYRQVMRINGVSYLLCQDEGRPYLVKNLCPHKHFPLHNGALEKGVLRCPQHGFDFSLKQGGKCLQQPSYCLEMFKLEYDGAEIGAVLP